jgi:hypothetical protein
MMADLGEVQRKFETDRALYNRFLSDPVGVLRELGVILTPQQGFELQYSIMRSTRPMEAAITSLAGESQDG